MFEQFQPKGQDPAIGRWLATLNPVVRVVVIVGVLGFGALTIWLEIADALRWLGLR